ncbi:MAG: ABC transporter permease, partial [Bacilli bacterium]
MIWAIAKKELKKNAQDIGTYIFLFVVPVIFIVLFGFAFGNADQTTLTIHVKDLANNKQSQQLIQQIDDETLFKVKKQTASITELRTQIKEERISHALVIPETFGMNQATAKLQLYVGGTEQPSATALATYLNGVSIGEYTGRLQAVLTQVAPNVPPMSPTFTLERTSVTIDDIAPITFILPGFVIMFAFYVIISMGEGFLKDVEKGMGYRLKATPMTPMHYLIGMWLPFLFIVLVQIGLLLGFGALFYSMDFRSPIHAIALIFALALFVTSLGLVFTFIIPSRNGVMAAVQIFVLGGAALGGLWFPVELFPEFLQKAAQLIPQYWFKQGLVDTLTTT